MSNMANLIYVANTSLDGYTEDKDGKFDWTDPNDEVFGFITNLIRATQTHLYGRRMYEAMMEWETEPKLAAESPLMRDFAETWQAANKIVYSRTLKTVSTRKTQLERTIDPEEIQQLKASSEHAHRRTRIGRPRPPGRVARRVSIVRSPDSRGRWQISPAQQRAIGARAFG